MSHKSFFKYSILFIYLHSYIFFRRKFEDKMSWLTNKLSGYSQWECVKCGTSQGFENQTCTNCGENMGHSIHETHRIEEEKAISRLIQEKKDGLKFYSKFLLYILILDSVLTGIYFIVNLFIHNRNANLTFVLAGFIPTLIFLILIPRKRAISGPHEYGLFDIINYLISKKDFNDNKVVPDLIDYQSVLSTEADSSIILFEKKYSTLFKIFYAIFGLIVIATIIYFMVKTSIIFSTYYIYGIPLLFFSYFGASEANKNRDNKIIISKDKLDITYRQINSEVKFENISNKSTFKNNTLNIYLKNGEFHSFNFGFFDSYNADQILFEINSRIKKQS